MVLVEVDSERVESYQWIKTCRTALGLNSNNLIRAKGPTCDDAVHRRYRDHRDACGVCQRDHDRDSRVHATFLSSWAFL